MRVRRGPRPQQAAEPQVAVAGSLVRRADNALDFLRLPKRLRPRSVGELPAPLQEALAAWEGRRQEAGLEGRAGQGRTSGGDWEGAVREREQERDGEGEGGLWEEGAEEEEEEGGEELDEATRQLILESIMADMDGACAGASRFRQLGGVPYILGSSLYGLEDL